MQQPAIQAGWAPSPEPGRRASVPRTPTTPNSGAPLLVEDVPDESTLASPEAAQAPAALEVDPHLASVRTSGSGHGSEGEAAALISPQHHEFSTTTSSATTVVVEFSTRRNSQTAWESKEDKKEDENVPGGTRPMPPMLGQARQGTMSALQRSRSRAHLTTKVDLDEDRHGEKGLENCWFEMLIGLKSVSTPAARWWVILVYLVDMGQALRTISSAGYGWSSEMAGPLRHVDICFVIKVYVWDLIAPKYFYFAFSAAVVLALWTLAFYNCYILGSNKGYFSRSMKRLQHKHKPPVFTLKAQKLLIAFVIKTFFVAVLQWILAPLNCMSWNQSLASTFLDREEDGCAPWAHPHVWVTLAVVLLCCLHLLYALCMTVANIEPNPAGRGAGAMYTIRVEVAWILSKVGIAVFVYLGRWISGANAALLVLACMTVVNVMHQQRLPFHSPLINQVRGGMYMAVLWQAVGAVVSCLAAQNASHESKLRIEYVLVGFMPIAFLGGWFMTQSRIQEIKHEVLKHEKQFKASVQELDEGSETDGTIARTSSADTVNGTPLPLSNVYDAFHVIIYYLRYHEMIDLGFIEHVMAKAREQFSDSNLVKMFDTKVSKFVAGELCVKSKMEQLSGWVPFDVRYSMYVLGKPYQRKAVENESFVSLTRISSWGSAVLGQSFLGRSSSAVSPEPEVKNELQTVAMAH